MPSLGELGVLAVLGGVVGLWGLWAGKGQVTEIKSNMQQCIFLQAPVLSCILESSGLPGLDGKVVLVTGANAGGKPSLSHCSNTKMQGLATTQPWPLPAGVGGW